MNNTRIIASLSFGALCVAHGFKNESVCPAKFEPRNTVCDTLISKHDSDFMFFVIDMPYPGPDSESSPDKLDSLRVWTRDLFSKYDLRMAGDTSQKFPEPSDSEVSWNYGVLNLRKKDALALVEERYVTRLYLSYLPTTTVGIPAIRYRRDTWGERVDAKGRPMPSKSNRIGSSPTYERTVP
jgi:hypothetical protein